MRYTLCSSNPYNSYNSRHSCHAMIKGSTKGSESIKGSTKEFAELLTKWPTAILILIAIGTCTIGAMGSSDELRPTGSWVLNDTKDVVSSDVNTNCYPENSANLSGNTFKSTMSWDGSCRGAKCHGKSDCNFTWTAPQKTLIPEGQLVMNVSYKLSAVQNCQEMLLDAGMMVYLTHEGQQYIASNTPSLQSWSATSRPAQGSNVVWCTVPKGEIGEELTVELKVQGPGGKARRVYTYKYYNI